MRLTFSVALHSEIPLVQNIPYLRNTQVNRPGAPQIPFSLFYVYEAMFDVLRCDSILFHFPLSNVRISKFSDFYWSFRRTRSAIFVTLVYDPIAHSIWSNRGWANRLGALHFAGGTPVHISSGSTALAISIYLRGRSRERTCISGWFGLDGGSALSPNDVTIQACINSNLAAAAGALTGAVLV